MKSIAEESDGLTAEKWLTKKRKIEGKWKAER
jgi:hypothetical protein